MNKTDIALLTILGVITSPFTFAENVLSTESVDYTRDAWGIQGAVVTNGNITTGVAYYTPHSSAGITVGAHVANHDNSRVTLSIFGGPRDLIHPQVYFAYGLDVGTTLGDDIKNSYFIGPYIGLDYYATTNILFSVFVNPAMYNHEEIKHQSTQNRVDIFSSGGIGISYLF